jgi:hypothetical protein
MIISKRFRCKFSRQKHMCNSFNCTWHVCRYSLNSACQNTNMTCWLRIFVDRLNIDYSKRVNVIVEEQRKRRLREKSNERKQCTSSCSQTKEKTTFFRIKLSSSFFWENERTCEAHIKRKIDADSARRWWKISRQRKWNCTQIWLNRKAFSLFIWKRDV